MKTKEAIQFLKTQLAPFLEKSERAISDKRADVCPICDIGHNACFATLFPEGQTIHCFSACNRSFDIFDIVRLEDQERKATGILGVELEGRAE